jgi:hypothetical protein
MRTTVDLDDTVLRRAKELAARSNRTLTAVLEDALREALGRVNKPAQRKALKLLTSNQRPGVCPGVDLDHSAALLELMEEEDAPA